MTLFSQSAERGAESFSFHLHRVIVNYFSKYDATLRELNKKYKYVQADAILITTLLE